MTANLESPFSPEKIAEVHLPAAPLAGVMTQIRFTSTARLQTSNAAELVANTFADDYPNFQQATEQTWVLSAESATPSESTGTLWRLSSADERWQLTVAPNFITLLTQDYTSRDEFRSRLSADWASLASAIRPSFVERVGFRYLNSVTDSQILGKIPSLIRPELIGGNALPKDSAAELVSSYNQVQLSFPEQGGLLARWGTMPANTVMDASLPPIPVPSWILDIDASSDMRLPVADFDADTVVDFLGDRAYKFFRWAVTPEFIAAFGGAE
ncbi:TIGR04255 family protein [Kocuria rosea]|uniref:TIGR04255 family protein n=1 Tax=Kocuria rosea TaxID=1275 RepID=UPI0025B766FE|nr:TIGR04255 family protein [Kocuria rosea]WJZ68592.1 TIGR04255 family protein [Kocuria rosea]